MPHSEAFKKITLEANKMVFDEGDMPDAAYMISEGSVEIRKGTRTENPRTIATLRKGSIFGELALINDVPRNAGAVTTEKCSLVTISKKAFKARLDKMDPVMLKVLLHLSETLNEINASSVIKPKSMNWSGWDRK